MSLHRRNPRRDANEKCVVDALRKAGAQVLRLNVFDLLVLYRGNVTLIDVKMPGARATQSQARLIRQGWPLQFVETAVSALRAIGAIK